MKVAIINDTHWGVKRSSRIFENHIVKFHDHLLNYCKENGITTIFHLGDFFDVRRDISYITLNTVKRSFLDKLGNIQMHVIPGNHDCPFKNNVESNAVSLLFEEYKNIHVYNVPTVAEFNDGSNVLFVPWIARDDEQVFLDQIKELSSQTKTCCGHFEFRGFVYQKGIVSEHGMDCVDFTSMFNIILSGHYHSKSERSIVHYLGTQYDLTWADYNEQKYFHVFDTNTLELTPIEYKEKIFIKLFYDESLISPKDIESIDPIDFNQKIVKIVVLNRKNMIMFDSLIEKLYSGNPHEISIVDESLTKVSSEIKFDETFISKGTFDIISEVVNDLELGADIVKSKILKNMSELYIRAHDD